MCKYTLKIIRRPSLSFYNIFSVNRYRVLANSFTMCLCIFIPFNFDPFFLRNFPEVSIRRFTRFQWYSYHKRDQKDAKEVN